MSVNRLAVFAGSDGQFIELRNTPQGRFGEWSLHHSWKNTAWSTHYFENIDTLRAHVIKTEEYLKREGFQVQEMHDMISAVAEALDATGSINIIEI